MHLLTSSPSEHLITKNSPRLALSVVGARQLSRHQWSAAGWHEYLQELLEAFRQYHLALLPEALAAAWGLPQETDLWSLLCSRHCHQVLLVGHSLGGALAAMTATLLGSAHYARSLAEGAMAEATPADSATAETDAAEKAAEAAGAAKADSGAGGGPSEAAAPRGAASSWSEWASWSGTWKAAAGRTTGGDGYVFGDLARSATSALGFGSSRAAAAVQGSEGAEPSSEQRGEATVQRDRGVDASSEGHSGAHGEAHGGGMQGAARGVAAARRGAGGDSTTMGGACEGQPMLVTFGCPVVGDSGFVAAQNRHKT